MRLVYAEAEVAQRQAYALRYRSYLDAQAIDASSIHEFSDVYENAPNTFTFNLIGDDGPVASIRACVQIGSDSTSKVPAWEIYQKELEGVLDTDFVLVESNRFVTEPGNHTITHAAVFLGISKVAELNNCTDVCTAIRTSQVAFYERFFGMNRISDPKKYHGINAEMVLMWANRKSFSWTGLERLAKLVDFDAQALKEKLIFNPKNENV